MEDYGMRLFIGLDVSLAKTAIGVISEHGKIIKEADELAPFSTGHLGLNQEA
jgi:predicted NBD/HSP70 family sugar kinase